MTPEERAAIEARDGSFRGAQKEHPLGGRAVTKAEEDRHALLDELRRVEQQRDRAMKLILAVYNVEWVIQYAELKAEIDGEKEKSGGARQD